jgi:hypothetical protein
VPVSAVNYVFQESGPLMNVQDRTNAERIFDSRLALGRDDPFNDNKVYHTGLIKGTFADEDISEDENGTFKRYKYKPLTMDFIDDVGKKMETGQYWLEEESGNLFEV